MDFWDILDLPFFWMLSCIIYRNIFHNVKRFEVCVELLKTKRPYRTKRIPSQCDKLSVMVLLLNSTGILSTTNFDKNIWI